MIYFVDEDVSQAGAWEAILKVRGFETRIIRDAESALDHFKSCEDAELVFIDVMLAGSIDGAGASFKRDETDDFQVTGVVLLDRLVKLRPDLFPRCAVLLSQAGKRSIVEQIEKACNAHAVPFWRKASFNDVFDFYSRVLEYMEFIGGVDGRTD